MLLCIELRGKQLAVLWPMVLRALVDGIDIVDAGAKDGFNPPSVRNSAKRCRTTSNSRVYAALQKRCQNHYQNSTSRFSVKNESSNVECSHTGES